MWAQSFFSIVFQQPISKNRFSIHWFLHRPDRFTGIGFISLPGCDKQLLTTLCCQTLPLMFSSFLSAGVLVGPSSHAVNHTFAISELPSHFTHLFLALVSLRSYRQVCSCICHTQNVAFQQHPHQRWHSFLLMLHVTWSNLIQINTKRIKGEIPLVFSILKSYKPHSSGKEEL